MRNCTKNLKVSNLHTNFMGLKLKAMNTNVEQKQKLGTFRPLSDWEYNQLRAENEKKLNEVLDKITMLGMNSLTKSEKRFLRKMSYSKI